MINIFSSLGALDILFRAGRISHADLAHGIFILPKIKPMTLVKLNREWAKGSKYYRNDPFSGVPFDAIEKAMEEGRVVYSYSGISLGELNVVLKEKFNLPPIPCKEQFGDMVPDWILKKAVESTGYPCRIISNLRE